MQLFTRLISIQRGGSLFAYFMVNDDMQGESMGAYIQRTPPIRHVYIEKFVYQIHSLK